MTFAPVIHQLTITRIGTGSGTVTSPVGFACGPTCALGIDEGTGALLRAVPDPGSEFTGWLGACTGAGAGCFVPMMQDTSVVANFTAKPSDSGGTVGGSSKSPVTPGSTCPPVGIADAHLLRPGADRGDQEAAPLQEGLPRGEEEGQRPLREDQGRAEEEGEARLASYAQGAAADLRRGVAMGGF